MVALSKFEPFVEDVCEGVHDLDTHQLRIALTNTAPTATWRLLSQLTGEITPYTNITENRNITLTTSATTGSTYQLTLQDVVLTATGAVASFRYVVIYNDGTAVVADPMIAWYDHGSSVTLANGETFTIDFDDTNGFFQISQS